MARPETALRHGSWLMRTGHIFLVFLALTGIHAQAGELCINPVPGGELVLDLERKQSYRIATEPPMLPGFDGLVFSARNRHEICEFDGKRLQKITGDFPHIWGVAHTNGILRIFPANPNFSPLFFHVKPAGLTYVVSAPRGSWKYHLTS